MTLPKFKLSKKYRTLGWGIGLHFQNNGIVFDFGRYYVRILKKNSRCTSYFSAGFGIMFLPQRLGPFVEIGKMSFDIHTKKCNIEVTF